MTSSASTAPRLVGDIGGTNTRLALFDPRDGSLRATQVYTNRDYPHLEDIISHWLATLAETAPRDCCLAVAAPPFDDRVSMLNIDWSFSCSEMATRFHFTRLRCINDFVGNAYALPHLAASDLALLRAGEPTDCRKLATVGPGTGLGGATLDFCVETPVANASEPGHMGLAAGSELELEILRALLPHHGEAYAELLVSGPGLQRLYTTLAKLRGETAQALGPAEIAERGLAGDCGLCATALHTFCALLGSVCGDFVLATGAYGGLYLAGGIVPGLLPLLQSSAFVQRFTAKGDMAPHLAKVPLYAITSGATGMLGAAHAPL